MKRKTTLFILLGLVLLATGCGGGGSTTQGESVTGKILATALDGPLKTGQLTAGSTIELTESELKFFLPESDRTRSYLGKGYTIAIRGEFSRMAGTDRWCPGDGNWDILQPQDVTLQERNGKFCLNIDDVIATATTNGRLADVSWDKSPFGGVKLIVFDTNGNRLAQMAYNCQLNILAPHPRLTPVANATITVQDTNTTAKSQIDGSFRIYGLTPGQHTLLIQANGFTGTRMTTVTAPGDVTIDMGYNIIQS